MIKNKKNETYRILNDKQNTRYCWSKSKVLLDQQGTADSQARYCQFKLKGTASSNKGTASTTRYC